VIVVDANILLYAYDRADPRHRTAARWLETVLGGSDQVGFALTTLLAFIRISTDPRVYERPMAPTTAIRHVERWLERSNVQMIGPNDRHWTRLADLITRGQARGPLVMDAHLATLAIEHGATLATTDRDLRRFPDLRTIDPTAA
jgi:toxin-antitoxin system PIN domain toxin